MSSSRFSAGLEKLKDAGGKAQPAAKPTATPAEGQGASPTKAAGRAPGRDGKVVIAAYFDPAVRKQLAILSVEQDQTQAALLAEALNLLFEKHGRPPIAKA